MGGMRHFFTGPAIKTDLLLVWLEKHGVEATSRAAEGEDSPGGGAGGEAGEEDLSREMEVWVAEGDYERARQLFFSEREDEL